MATLTNAQAIANIESFYKKFLPTYVAKLPNDSYQYAIELFNAQLGAGSSLKASYDYVIAQAVVMAAGFENAYPSNPVPTGGQIVDPIGFANTFPNSEVINYLYPNASAADKATLISSMQNGSLSVTDFASSISIIKSSNPTPDEIIKAPETLTGAANLPDSGLQFAGVTDGQLDLVISMYIGAFGRTPEFEGLEYWAKEFATNMSHGMKQNEAFQAVGQNIYKAGTENGEAGTTLNNADYVTFAYNNALGRPAEKSGYDYWVNDLDSGQMGRGDFLTTFLTAGLDHERDSNFLVARIAVGKFAAQNHVSGIGAPGIDSKAILAGVTDIASANNVISGIIAQYGAAPAAIELTGVTTFELFA